MTETLFYNLKGGQGKTSLSLAIALEINAAVIANESYSPIFKILPEGSVRLSKEGESINQLPKARDGVKLIYDWGGRPDSRVIDLAEKVDRIVIPVIFEDQSMLNMQTAITTVATLEENVPREKIIIVLNKYKNQQELDAGIAIINTHFEGVKILGIKKSTAFARVAEKAQPLTQIMTESNLLSKSYKTIYANLKSLINEIA